MNSVKPEIAVAMEHCLLSHSLSGKFLVREWRSGELGILLLALVLAVSVVVGVSSFVGHCSLRCSPKARGFSPQI